MKRNFMALIVFISIAVCGTSITNAQKKCNSSTSIMEVNIKGAKKTVDERFGKRGNQENE